MATVSKQQLARALDELSAARSEVIEAQKYLDNAKKKALEKKDEYDRLVAQLESQSSRSLDQQRLQETESRILGLPTVRLTLKESEARLQKRQDEIDKLMNDANRKIRNILNAYNQNDMDCDHMVDPDECHQDNIEAASSDIQDVVDDIKPQLKKLGVDRFVQELDIPDAFDITE